MGSEEGSTDCKCNASDGAIYIPVEPESARPRGGPPVIIGTIVLGKLFIDVLANDGDVGVKGSGVGKTIEEIFDLVSTETFK